MESRIHRFEVAPRGAHILRARRLGNGLLCLGLLLSLAGSAAALTLNGSATQIGSTLRLTPSEPDQAGSAWSDTKQQVDAGFDTAFTFQITDLVNTGADGFAFVVQNNSSSALGFGGGGIGYFGIPNSLAVEFDTWFNPEWNDPNDNHISVHTNGTGPNSIDEIFSIGLTTAIPDLSDGQVHGASIHYVPGTLQVSLDGSTVLTVAVDLATLLNLDAGRAFVGFTAATGGAWENHDILSWSFTGATPQQQIQAVARQVNALVGSVLNRGEGNALTAKLDAAIAALNRGNQNAARNELQAFINQVNALMRSGRLSSAQGQALIGTAQAIITSLGA